MDDRGATHLIDLLTHHNEAHDPRAGTGDGPDDASTLYLIVLRGDVPGRMIRLGPGIQTIGRGSDNRVSLPEMNVSRVHARLLVDEIGRVWLTDDASTNGTFLNGQRLAAHQTVGVRDGDRLSFGPSVVLKCLRTDPLDERHHREMFERSVRDALTGLYNRSYFLSQIDVLAQQVFRSDLGLAVLMLDVDHFKRINDSFGHDAGDAVLREIAARLRQATRADDLVARYGGEEFVAALPIASPAQARERAQRIWQGLRAQPLLVQGRELAITASIGVAYADPDLPRPNPTLLAMADKALYQAKHRGRDRVCLYDGLNRDTTPDPKHPLPPSKTAPKAQTQPRPIPPGLTTVDFEAFSDLPAPNGNSPALGS